MSELYSNNDWRDYQDLEHYGIKGQKWGVKNGPPYPLKEETHNRVVSGKADSTDRMHVKNSFESTMPKFTAKDYKAYSKTHPVESISEMDRLPKFLDLMKSRYTINHVGGSSAGRHYNCPNCASAFEMVERGYDVVARPKPNGSNVEDVEKLFKGGSLHNVGTSEYDSDGKLTKAFKDWEAAGQPEDGDVYNELLYQHDKHAIKAEKNIIYEIKSQGSGSRGILVVGWHSHFDPNKRTTEFHAMNYKNEGGKIIFYDAQTKGEYNGITDSEWIRWQCDPRELFVMRTDNLEPSDSIGEAVISRRRAN